MSELATYKVNQASLDNLVTHLVRCDDSFAPALSKRVDLREYSQKIIEKAVRFEAWNKARLVGLVAVYCNDPEKRTAYITSVSVVPTWRKRGIAAQLLAKSIEYVQESGFANIALEVSQYSRQAVSLYEKHGFAPLSNDGCTLTMNLQMVNIKK